MPVTATTLEDAVADLERSAAPDHLRIARVFAEAMRLRSSPRRSRLVKRLEALDPRCIAAQRSRRLKDAYREREAKRKAEWEALTPEEQARRTSEELRRFAEQHRTEHERWERERRNQRRRARREQTQTVRATTADRRRALARRFALDLEASPDEIKRRLRDLARKHHPDLGGSHEDMCALNELRALLEHG